MLTTYIIAWEIAIASWLNHKVKILRCVYIHVRTYTGNSSWKLLSFTFRGFFV